MNIQQTLYCQLRVLCLVSLMSCAGSAPERIDFSTAATDACAGKSDGELCDAPAVSDLRYRNICVTGVCSPTRCGDGIVDADNGEECDDANGIEADGCEPETCKYTCTLDAQCSDGDSCNGDDVCNTTLHRCTTTPDDKEMSSCGLKLAGTSRLTGLCRYDDNGQNSACVPTGCLDGKVQGLEECDDGNLIDNDGCDRHCMFSCQSGNLLNQRSCPPAYCDATGTLAFDYQCTPVYSGTTMVAKRCELANANGQRCTDLQAKLSPTGCTRISCVDGMGCAFVPLLRTSEGAQPDSPAITKTGIINRSVKERFEAQKRQDCGATCSAPPNVVFPTDVATGVASATPYCQRIGTISTIQAFCYNSFDYDCDGYVRQTPPECSESASASGWVIGSESQCGQNATYVDVGAYDAASCARNISNNVVECR